MTMTPVPSSAWATGLGDAERLPPSGMAKPNLNVPAELKDEAFVREFCLHVSNGLPIAKAALLMRVHPKRVGKWLENGRADPDEVEVPPEYAAFAMEVDRARALLFAARLADINKAAKNGDWRAADRVIERTFPDEWVRPGGGVMVSGDPSNPLRIQLSFPTGMQRDDAIDSEIDDAEIEE